MAALVVESGAARSVSDDDRAGRKPDLVGRVGDRGRWIRCLSPVLVTSGAVDRVESGIAPHGRCSRAMVLTGILSAYAWPGNTERMWKVVAPRVETLEGLWSGDRDQIERAVTWRLSI